MEMGRTRCERPDDYVIGTLVKTKTADEFREICKAQGYTTPEAVGLFVKGVISGTIILPEKK